MPTYLSGTIAKANIPVSAPVGFSISVAIVLTTDAGGQNPIAGFPTAQTTAKPSTGSVVAYAINVPMPSALSTYYVVVDVYVNGNLYGIFPQGEQMTVGQITVGNISWS